MADGLPLPEALAGGSGVCLQRVADGAARERSPRPWGTRSRTRKPSHRPRRSATGCRSASARSCREALGEALRGGPAGLLGQDRPVSRACGGADLLLGLLGVGALGDVDDDVVGPLVCTSASETPRPLTRRFMMSTAVSMLALLIADPWSAFAFSVMLVPPARSIPRRGVVCPERNIPPVSATMAIRMRASERPGLLWALALRPLLGAATFSYSPLGPPRARSARSASDMESGSRAGNRRARDARGAIMPPPRLPGRDYFASESPSDFFGSSSAFASAASFLPRSILSSEAAAAAADPSVSSVSVREEASSGTRSASDFRSCSMPWTMRLYSSSERTAPMAFLAKRRSTPGPASRRTVSSLTSLDRRVHPPDRADAGAGLHLVPHLDGLLLLLLGRSRHQEHGRDEHDEGEKGIGIHGTEFPSRDRAGERPVGWGVWSAPPARAASAESKRVRSHGTTLSMAPGFLPGPPSSPGGGRQAPNRSCCPFPAAGERGGVRPRCAQAAGVATRPRGVRASSPSRTRKGFGDLLHGLPLLPHRDGERGQADRSAAEQLQQGFQDGAVEPVEAARVDLVHREGRRRRCRG